LIAFSRFSFQKGNATLAYRSNPNLTPNLLKTNVQAAESVSPTETKNSINDSRWRRFGPLGLLALSLFALFYGLGNLPFLGPDEPRYAEVAREMYLSGDWITPRLADIPWFEKPALTYWLSALGFKLFGVSEFAARIGITLLAAIGALLLYGFGCRVNSARYGYVSASVLLTMALWLGFARAATFDLPLSVCLTAALLAFFLWEQSTDSEKPRDVYWYAFAAALGFALLAKGLVGIVLPVGIIGAYLLLTRRLRLLWQPKLLLLGSLLMVGIAATWYGPMLMQHGRAFIDEFIIGHHFQRYVSNKYKHPQPFYFFLLVSLAGCLPWTAWLIASAQRAVQERRALLTEPAERLRLFLWLWLLVPLVFFSLSGSKLPGYILPIFPALALLVGLELERFLTTEKLPWAAWATVILCLLLGGAVWLANRKQPVLAASSVTALACLAAFVALLYLAFLLMRRFGLATVFLPLGITLLFVVTLRLVTPVIAQRESLREFIRTTRQLAFPGERAVFFINNHHSFDFYAPDMPLRDAKSELITAMSIDEIETLMKERNLSSLIVITPQRWSNGLVERYLQIGRLDFPKGDDRVAICSPGCGWVMMRVWLRKPNL
jgi:4-amino-4-deoxy-L-arabinose transferase-like glycosyltransferase